MHDRLMIQAQRSDGSALRILAARLLDATVGTTLVNLLEMGNYLVGTWLADVPVGTHRLVLDIEGHPTLEFSVDVEGDSDRSFEFTRPTPMCATVTVQQASAGDAHSARLYVVSLSLSARHEHVVLVAGVDLKGGTDYMKFASTWRDDIYHGRTDLGATPNLSIPRAITDLTVVSMFDFRTGNLDKCIKGIDGWHRISRAMQGSERPDIAKPKSDDALERRQNADSISILHVYQHIDALGQTQPGSVRQLHFFSHGYRDGPVLLNTYDNIKGDARDPTDKDPRTKDFLPSNLARFSNFKAAFMRDAYVKAWGCFGSDMVKKLRAVSRTKNIDEQVSVKGQPHTYSSADVIRELRRDTLPDSYMVQFCQTIGVDGWSAPPGVTSSYKSSSRRYYFDINEDVHGDVVAWYERYFGCVRDLSGMVSFRKLV
jgi:hypothetical protein